MLKRHLKRQLGLAQVIMLGAIGTIGAQIFVLTGYAAGLVGPATLLALLLGGLLTYSVALNYCEMATSYPVAGGAMTYVREAFGTNLLSFLVGSMDCLSSTFFSALSAVGFAYSLRIFLPGLSIPFTAITVIGLFTLLNLLGVTRVGNAQIVLGGFLLLLLGAYVIAGFTSPLGFRWETLIGEGHLFIYPEANENAVKMLEAVALMYISYVGFEVIADDAEEVENPSRNIPFGILISLTLVIVIYLLVVSATLGTVSWRDLAGSATALTDVAQRLLPRWGAPLMGLAGLIATLTSINTAMLSGTREAFTLSRFGFWPQSLSHLSRFRTPDVAIVFFGAVTAVVAVTGPVDFLSYISSSGYLFVLFWASLAMIRLRRLYPNLKRPFKVPFFPLTAYLAAASGCLIIAFTPWRALLFGAGVLAACSVFYALYRPMSRLVAQRLHNLEAHRNRLVVAASHPRTAESLLHLAALLVRASEDSSVCLLTVVPVSPNIPPDIAQRLADQLRTRPPESLRQLAQSAHAENLPLFTRLRASTDVAHGILAELDGNVKLVLMGWPGPLNPDDLAENVVKVVLMKAHTNVAVLLDRGLKNVRRILVPVGGGPHSRLAVRLAYEIGEPAGVPITVLHCFDEASPMDELEDQLLHLREIVVAELGAAPKGMVLRLARAHGVTQGILAEVAAEADRDPFDLIVIGASEEWISRTRLFGTVDDEIAAEARCSVLLVRRYEPAAIAWVRQRVSSPH